MFHNTSTDSLRTVKWLLTPKECVFSKKKKESNFTFAQWICDSVLKTCVWAKHASSSLQAQQSSGGQGRKIPWTQSRLGLHSEFQTSLDDIQCVALAQKTKQANRKKSCIFLAAEAGDLETTFPVLNTPHSFPHCRSLALFMLCYVMLCGSYTDLLSTFLHIFMKSESLVSFLNFLFPKLSVFMYSSYRIVLLIHTAFKWEVKSLS